jgi:hypothetical protein
MNPLAGLAVLAGAIALGATRTRPEPEQGFWEENLFDERFFLFMFKTDTVFSEDAFGPTRGGKPVWDFRITDEAIEAAFAGQDTFSRGRAAAIQWAIRRQNTRPLEGFDDFNFSPDVMEVS